MSFNLFPGFSSSTCCCNSSCCGVTLTPRSQRSDQFQATVMSIQAIFALGQQDLPRSNEAIFLAASQLNPSESISQNAINQALGAGLSTGLFCLGDCGYYSVNTFAAATQRNLKKYYPFVLEYNPCKVLYPPLDLV